MPHNYRQEVFNVLLAQILQEQGIISAPEDVLKIAPDVTRKMPDVLVDFSGLRTAIEGEVDDQADYANKALHSAKKRVELGIAHIGVAIVYPAELRKYEFADLKNQLTSCELRIAVVTEGGATSYSQGNVNQLGEALRRAFGELVKEDVVAKAVDALETGIEQFARVVVKQSGTSVRLADILGIKEIPKREKAKLEEDEE
jgi:hypothetical protein